MSDENLESVRLRLLVYLADICANQLATLNCINVALLAGESRDAEEKNKAFENFSRISDETFNDISKLFKEISNEFERE